MKTRAFTYRSRSGSGDRPSGVARWRWGISRPTRMFKGVPAAPSVEEAAARLRDRPTLLSKVTPELLAAFEAYEGTEFVGRNGPRVERRR